MKNKILLSLLTCFLLAGFSLQAQNIREYTPMEISEINSVEYGQGTAFGFSIFGDGIGFMVRHTLKSQDQIGLGTHFFTLIEQNAAGNGIERIVPGLFFRGEYNIHLGNTLKEKVKKKYVKRRFRKHYLSVKAGAGFSDLNFYSAVLSWHLEGFKLENKNHARGLDLGVSYNFIPDNGTNLILNNVGIYFRLDWTWFKNKINK